MQIIPPDILARFDDILKQRGIPLFQIHEYRQWLRYFLDFRAEYPLSAEQNAQGIEKSAGFLICALELISMNDNSPSMEYSTSTRSGPRK